MLFLGAGASKPFGIGDLENLTRGTDRILLECGYGDLLENIRNGLSGSSFFPTREEIDMEVILSILDYFAHPESILEKVGPAGVLLKSELESIRSGRDFRHFKDREYESIRNRIELLIVETCTRCNFGKALQYYSKLFQLDNSHAMEFVNATGSKVGEHIFKRVATTNYDLILERYDYYNIEPERHLLRRGFKRLPRGYDWEEPILKIENVQNEVIYLKLHGSIDWWLRGRDKNIVPREGPESLLGEEYLGRVMIYPIYGKTTTRRPFVTLYEAFRKFLKADTIFVCIGYSFRDKSINDGFLEALEEDSSKRLVIINSRSSRERIARVVQDFPQEQLDYLDTLFGDKMLFDRLLSVLKIRSRGAR